MYWLTLDVCIIMCFLDYVNKSLHKIVQTYLFAFKTNFIHISFNSEKKKQL